MSFFLGFLLLLVGMPVLAGPGIPAISVVDGPGGEQTYTVTLQIVVLMTALTLIPAALMTMTSFMRIIIVLALLRQGLGTMQTPTNQILIGLALFLTFFIMAPIFNEINEMAVQPYLSEEIVPEEAIKRGAKPLHQFMMVQTRETDLALFWRISGQDAPESMDKTPFSLLIPAFITSELKTAFQIGFMIFIPFLVIDLVVASVLMSMGMMMLSPMIISLPFKIMLFVLIDGWALVLGTLAESFVIPS
jgi:flagellar biosynthesis protein FliP